MERAIERVGKAIGTIAPLLQHFDMETNIKQVSKELIWTNILSWW